jgi:hypothetical protein
VKPSSSREISLRLHMLLCSAIVISQHVNSSKRTAHVECVSIRVRLEIKKTCNENDREGVLVNKSQDLTKKLPV